MNTIEAYKAMRKIKEAEADFLEFFKTRHGSSFTRCYCTPALYTKLIGNLPQNSIHPVYNMQIVWLDCKMVSWANPKQHMAVLLIGSGSPAVDSILLNKGLAFLSLGGGQAFLDKGGHLMNPDQFERFQAVMVRLDFAEMDHGRH